MWILGGSLLLGAARVVALPEVCNSAGAEERDDAIGSAVAWLTKNQNDDGTFLYGYDARSDAVSGDYNWIRHAGTILALEQATHQGFPEAFEAGEKAIAAALRKTVTKGRGLEARSGLIERNEVSTGGTALLVLALLERRDATSRTDHDVAIRSMLRHLADSLDPGSDGVTRVRAAASLELEFSSNAVALFSTSQTLFAFSRAERIFPNEGWGQHAHPILEYLALHKAVEEGFVPDMADHWAAYALAETTMWVEPFRFTDVEIAWVKKQMGLSSVMIRYESQITDRGLNLILRGHSAIGAAAGTHGESVASWLKVALHESALRSRAAGLADRLACNNSLLVARQISSVEAAGYSNPTRVSGAWLSSGRTQVDDQQHAASALLLGREIEKPEFLGGGELPRRQSLPSSAGLVALTALALLNPPRLVRTLRHLHASRSINGLVARHTKPSLSYLYRFVLFFGVLTVNGSWLLRQLDTNVPTALVATGVVGALASLSTLSARRVAPSMFYVTARPELLLFGIAAGAGGQWWPLMVGLLAAIGWSYFLLRRVGDLSLQWATRLTALTTVALAIMLIVNGVFAV